MTTHPSRLVAVLVLLSFAGASCAKSSDDGTIVAPATTSTIVSPSTGAPSSTSVQHAATTTLIPADSPAPAAGACDDAAQPVATVTINPDVPSPRCIRVTPEKQVNLRNMHGDTITITFGGETKTLAPNAAWIVGPFMNFAKGVHVAKVDKMGGSGPEIWVV